MDAHFLQQIQQDNIKHIASKTVYKRGLNYFRLRRVELISDKPNHVHLHVRGSSQYCVDVFVDRDGDLDYDCTCPYAATDYICKHIVASYLFLKNQKPKPPQNPWKRELDTAIQRLQYAGKRKSTPHPYLVYFSLQPIHNTYYKVLAYKVKTSLLPPEIYDKGLKISVSELAERIPKIQRVRQEAKPINNKLSAGGCLNGSDALISLINIAQSNYYYYDTPFFAHMRGLASLGAQLFYGTTKNPFVRPIQVSTDEAESQLVLEKTDKGLRLKVQALVGDKAISLDPKSVKIIGDDPKWLMTDDELIEATEDFNPILINTILDQDPFEVPEAQVAFFLDQYLMPLADQISVVGEHLIWHEIEDDNPQKQLYLSEEGNTLLVELGFEYAGNTVLYNKTARRDSLQRQDDINDPDNIHILKITRDLLHEEDVWRSVSSASHGLKRASQPKDHAFTLRANVDPVDFLLRKIPILTRDGFTVFGEDTLKKNRVNRHFPSLTMSVSSGIDWFDVKTLVQFGDVPIKISAIRKAISQKQRFVKLTDGSIGEIPDEFLEQYKHLFQLGEQHEDSVRFANHHITFIDDLLNKVDDVEVDQQFNKRLTQLKEFEQIEEKPLHDTFQGELRPYQKSGFDWLHFLNQFNFGGILADDMGLGKTVQVLSFLQSLRANDSDLPPDLIVLPRSLLLNWEREVQNFTPNLTTFIFFGPSRPDTTKEFAQYDLILTTYGTMRSDIEMLKEYLFHYVVLDESQAIKNPNTLTAKATRLLKSKHRLAMTGTPVENSTFELWSQFAFLNPGLLGNVEYFKREFGNPIQRNQDEDSAKLLRQMVYPFILRRTKAQVAPDLPPRTERVVYTDMEPAQRKFYDRTRDDYRAQLLKTIASEGMNKARFKVLEGLLRLRQICNHPKLFRPNFRGNSGKLDLLLETMENLASEGHKALIFSQFVQMLKIVEKELKKRKIPYAYLDGQTRKRQEAVDEFQENPDLTFFLISLKAGGVGLNLTAADYVIHIDPWWNPAVEMQATDRTHRIGQDKPVFVYKLITRDSVEEKILQLQEKKKDLVEKLIVTEGSFFKDLSADDIQVLFS